MRDYIAMRREMMPASAKGATPSRSDDTDPWFDWSDFIDLFD
jgi:hypothetical protein